MKYRCNKSFDNSENAILDRICKVNKKKKKIEDKQHNQVDEQSQKYLVHRGTVILTTGYLEELFIARLLVLED